MTEIKSKLRIAALVVTLMASGGASIANAYSTVGCPCKKDCEPGPYFRLDGYQTWYVSQKIDGVSKSSKSNAFIGGGIGYDFDGHLSHDGLRLELVGQSTRTMAFSLPGSKLKAKAWGWFVNLNYDLTFKSLQEKNLTPYFMGGAGQEYFSSAQKTFANGTAAIKYKGKAKTAWNVGVGVMYDFNKRFSVDVGYRYVQVGSFAGIGTIKGNQAILGVIVNV